MELIAQVWSIIHDPEAVESQSLFVLKSPSKLKFLEMEEISNFSSSSPSLCYMLLHTLVQVSFHPHFMGVQVDKLWEHKHSSYISWAQINCSKSNKKMWVFSWIILWNGTVHVLTNLFKKNTKMMKKLELMTCFFLHS